MLRPSLIKDDSVNLVITGKCNIHCVYCEYPVRYKDARELTSAEWIDVISDLRASGYKHFMIVGGEPLLRKDWPSIVDACLPDDVGLVTNATFIDGRLADEVAKRFANVRISLDASNPVTYEAVRCSKRYPQVIQSIKLLVRRGVRVDTSYIITDKNAGDIYATAKLAGDLGVSIQFSIVGFENNNNTATTDRTLRDNIDLRSLVEQLALVAPMSHVTINRKTIEFLLGVHAKRCYSTVGGIMIDSLGDVYPCCGPTPAIGNLRETRWADIAAKHSALRESYRRMRMDGCDRCDSADDGYRFLRKILPPQL